MTSTESLPLSALYESDETAWLELMASHAEAGRYEELDLPNLSEFLSSMAKRDRREVLSRLVVLLAHLLKWDHQPERRSGSWHATILEQRRELNNLFESGTLHEHAQSVYSAAYKSAKKEAAAETGLPRNTFPAECQWDLETILADEESES